MINSTHFLLFLLPKSNLIMHLIFFDDVRSCMTSRFLHHYELFIMKISSSRIWTGRKLKVLLLCSIRAMCGEDLERNSVNGSDSRESAAREISFFC
ncbi:putative nucleoside diphosphate kinase-like domain-containing protein [Helianthus anomalus]